MPRFSDFYTANNGGDVPECCDRVYPNLGDVCTVENADVTVYNCSGYEVVQGYFLQDGETLYRRHKVTYTNPDDPLDTVVFEEWYELGSDFYNSSGSTSAWPASDEWLDEVLVSDVFALEVTGVACWDTNLFSSWDMTIYEPYAQGYILTIRKQEVDLRIETFLEACGTFELRPDTEDGWETEYEWPDTATTEDGPGVGVTGGLLDVPAYLEGNTSATHYIKNLPQGDCCNPRPIEDFWGLNQPPA